MPVGQTSSTGLIGRHKRWSTRRLWRLATSTASPGPSWTGDAPLLAAAGPAAHLRRPRAHAAGRGGPRRGGAADAGRPRAQPDGDEVRGGRVDPPRGGGAPGVLAVLRHLDHRGLAVPARGATRR